MKFLRYVTLVACISLFFAGTSLGVKPVRSQSPDLTPPSYEFITLDELGYREVALESPYDSFEYVFRLPEGWVLREGSFFELDFSYGYENLYFAENQLSPTFFGDVTIVVDGQTQYTYVIEKAVLEHSSLRVDLPLDLFNVSGDTQHTIEIGLQASHICRVPHRANLVIHPSSFLSLSYEQLPVTIDLGRYPRPFYQRAFDADRVLFALPTRPSQMVLAGSAAVAAKLGDLTYNNAVISGTTDLKLLRRLWSLRADETISEHLVIIGQPETNEMLLTLNRLDALPLPLRARQLAMASQGPSAVAPGDSLTYTFTLTNTTNRAFSSLILLDTLPPYAQVLSCTHGCFNGVTGEISWTLPSLDVGTVLTRTLVVRLNDVLTDTVIENTATLFDPGSGPLNVDTLTTTIHPLLSQGLGTRSSVSPDKGYFFWTGERAVPENDGVVQELVSPWNRTRAILIITGLSDQAVYKACRAMSAESRFPGMRGSSALVRAVHPKLKTALVETPATDLTFADLGYDDRELLAFSQDINYHFDIPPDWRITEDFTLDLHFNHSKLLNYELSYFSVLFNNEFVATIPLSDETALDGNLKINLPFAQARSGERNRITIQSMLEPSDLCAGLDIWLRIKNTSLLHLGHVKRADYSIDLELYPNLFLQRRDLADVLFILPSEPSVEEWEATLRLAADLGDAAGASDLFPMVSLGNAFSEAGLRDHHLIAIGRPSRNPVLRQINPQLPQPFQLDSDMIAQEIDNIIFRLPSDLSLGLIQLLVSPWNEKRAFMAVTGTTDAGVKQSTTLLVEQPWQLEGNLLFIREERVNTIDTRGLTSIGAVRAAATAVAGMSSTTTTPMSVSITQPITNGSNITPTLVAQPPASTFEDTGQRDYPSWIVPLVAGTILTIIFVFAIAFWQTKQRGT